MVWPCSPSHASSNAMSNGNVAPFAVRTVAVTARPPSTNVDRDRTISQAVPSMSSVVACARP